MMEYTLLIRLAGPLQSWGTDSYFENRRTEMIPTKSGVIGLLAAALGRRRDEDISDLSKLKFGVRADQSGTVIVDFQTATNGKSSYLSNRYYLSDAKFLAGISSSDLQTLEELQKAIETPAYPLFLGRRSCPPGIPLSPRIVDKPLKEALADAPLLAAEEHTNSRIHVFLESEPGGIIRMVEDEPVSFDFHHRKYRRRSVTELVFDKSKAESVHTEHDPIAALGELQ